VIAVLDDDQVIIDCERHGTSVLCEQLRTSEQSGLALAPGDEVMVWISPLPLDTGVILGRVGASHGSVPAADANNELSDELVIEAKKNLILKCGSGSITIREDGKILIKGKDLVSHAQRMNRIKGGSVSIN